MIAPVIAMIGGDGVARVAAALVMAAAKGSVLLAVAWTATRALRHGSAAARHLVWTSALAGMLVMPFLTTLLPAIHLPGVPRFTIVRSTPDAASSPASASAVTEPASARATRGSRVSSAAASAAPVPSAPIDVWSFLPLVWAIGSALLLLRLAVGTLRVSLWSRRARAVDDGTWLTLTQRLASRLHIARPVTLLRSERACVPMTWGIVYPTVLLPIDADEWPEERRNIVLLHELAHVKRMDALTQLVAQLATGIFWFNPLVWMAARQMRTEREHACDDCVLQGGARASDYAQDLLEIARSLGGFSAPASAALAMARRGEFEGRLLAILDPHTNRRDISPLRFAAATLAVAIVALPLAALTPASAAATSGREPKPVIAAVTATTEAALPKPTPPAPPAPRAVDRRAPSTPARTLMSPAAPASRAQQPPPDRETLIAVARSAKRMTSDYEKAELLLTIARYYIRDDELRTVYLEAVASMTSDNDRSRTLAPLLLKDSLPMSAVAQVVRIAAAMTSDNDKGALIVKVATEHRSLTQPIRSALIAALSSMVSDYDRHRSVTALVTRGELSKGDVIGLINAASGMSGSYDKSQSLIELAAHFPLTDDDVRKAYFKAAETISSPTDYRRVIAGILK